MSDHDAVTTVSYEPSGITHRAICRCGWASMAHVSEENAEGEHQLHVDLSKLPTHDQEDRP